MCVFFLVKEVVHMDPWNNIEYLPCQRKHKVPELSVLCEEINKRTSHQFFAVAEYPAHICHYPFDTMATYLNITKLYSENKNINEYPSQEQWLLAEENRRVKFDHAGSAFACNFRAILDILDAIFKKEF